MSDQIRLAGGAANLTTTDLRYFMVLHLSANEMNKSGVVL